MSCHLPNVDGMDRPTAALAWAEAGFRVFPADGKRPVRGVKWKTAASRHPDRIRSWWAQHPEANIAVIPGSGHCVVCDVDGQVGEQSWACHPDAPTAQTRTGNGRHLWYRVPDGVEVGNGHRLGDSIDVRGHAGYVIVAPSIHPDGPTYTLEGLTPVEAPTWLLDRLAPDRPVTGASADPSGAPPAAPLARPATAVCQEARDLADRWAEAGPGGRHAGLISVTMRMAELIRDGQVGRESALALLEGAAVTNGKADTDGWRGEIVRALDGALQRVAVEAPPIRLTTAAELWTLDAGKVDWLVEDVLEAGRLTALIGPAKSGKTLLVQEVVLALVSGRGDVLGQGVPRRRRVLYLDQENSQIDWRARMEAFGYSGDDDLSGLDLASFPGLDLTSAGGASQLLQTVDQTAPDLVVLDTSSRFIRDNENDSKTWHAMCNETLAPLKGLGIAVVRIDHTGKDPERGARGSSAKSDDVDVAYQLKAADGWVWLTRTHSRQGYGLDTLTLRRHQTPRLSHEPATPNPTAARNAEVVADVVARLDELGVPDDAGRRVAAQALQDADGSAVAKARLGDAVRVRKERR